ncbi:Hypothetical predicted protein [Marmota monax]|uniref:Uncharacterized protein n=1 Tax=Marmota monax TaxID=9995 RepID=A0A5E4BUU4_MARMO|nr:Hypothetical predicted protein [Marmota monax]
MNAICLEKSNSQDQEVNAAFLRLDSRFRNTKKHEEYFTQKSCPNSHSSEKLHTCPEFRKTLSLSLITYRICTVLPREEKNTF